MTSVVLTEASASSRSAPTGSLGKVVAVSLAGGLAAALVLTLVVFAGAGESTILGAALLAFGGGWAALAHLSTRLTAQPQRWAWVPAAAMSATGLALLVLSPGDDTLTALGWVWPPALLVLTIWSQRRAHRQLRSRTGTLLVYPVLAALTLSAVGGGYETVRLSADSSLAAPGRIVDVGGRGLHVQCSGSGLPVVVLANGLGEHSPHWSWIRATVSRTTTVCAYDRAGQAWSDASSEPADGQHIAQDLRALLTAAGLPGPYVLAGHSTGGLYAQVFAARYPDAVAGMVLLDSLTPRAMTALPSYPGFYAMFRRASALLPSLARTGAGQVAFAAAGSSLPPEARRAERAIATSPREQRSGHHEFRGLRATFAQAQELTSIGDLPLAVVTANRGMQDGWLPEQRRMATLSTNAVHSSVPATHESLIHDRADSSYASGAVTAVVRAVRTGSRVELP
jgi:pimeloyl-ACP methyl ester carboxylesterase